jgi:hypothetical protein
MQKTYCDICNCEINTPTIAIIGKDKYAKTEVIIHHEGRTLDICDACRNKLVRYAFYDMRGIVDPVNMGF